MVLPKNSADTTSLSPYPTASLLRRNIKSFVESEKRFGMGFAQIWSKLQDIGLGDESAELWSRVAHVEGLRPVAVVREVCRKF